MTTKEVATLLVDMCRKGQVEEAKEKLFAEDIISIDPGEVFCLEKQKAWMLSEKKLRCLFRW